MMKLVALLFTLPVFAQVDGITTSATRTLALTPDQAVFSVAVAIDPGATQEQVLQTLSGIGVAATDLVSISSSAAGYNPPGQSNPTRLVYQANFTVNGISTSLR